MCGSARDLEADIQPVKRDGSNVRSPALRWIMREGPLSCIAWLGKHAILRHDPSSRTGEAA